MLKRIVPLVLALVLCAGLAQAKTKAPATQLPGDLTLAEAQKVLDAALVKAKAQGVPMNIAIVDAGGNLKAFVRQDGAFIGSDTMMVAPVNVGAHTLVAAGSVITKDVPDGALAIARGRQENHEGWVEKHHPSN